MSQTSTDMKQHRYALEVDIIPMSDASPVPR